jgi:hypothetical protein
MIKRKISIEKELQLLSSPQLYRRHTLNVMEFYSQVEDFILQYFGGAYEISLTRDYDFLSVSPRCFASILKIAVQRNPRKDTLRVRAHAGLKVSEIAIEFNTSALLPSDIAKIANLAELSGHEILIKENEILLTANVIPVTFLELYAGKSKILLHALEEIFLY